MVGRQVVSRFLREEDGLTSVEYGFLAVLVLVACIVGVTLFGKSTNAVFQNNVNHIVSGP